MKTTLVLAATVTLALGIGGCANPGRQDAVARNKNVPQGDAIVTKCKNSKVDHNFELDVSSSNTPNMVTITAWEYDSDPAKKTPYVYTPNTGHVSTPLNINLGLDDSVRQRVNIHVVIDKNTGWTLFDNNMGVTSNDVASHKKMFCEATNGSYEAIVGAEYLPKEGSSHDQPVFGTYNLNFIVPFGNGVLLPVSFDPEVKNEG